MLIGVPYFLLLDSKVGVLVVLAIVVSLIPHDMQYGPQAALIAESFPTRRRYSGAGLGYQLASVFAGGPAPLLATWLLHTFDSSTADRHLHRGVRRGDPDRDRAAARAQPRHGRARVRAGRGSAGARAGGLGQRPRGRRPPSAAR